MRLRFHSVIYQSGSAAPSLEHPYDELGSGAFPLGQRFTFLRAAPFWRPSMDIHETPNAVLVKIELAGMDEESVQITLYPNAIVVIGERIDDSENDEATYYREAQIRYGPFRADAYLSTPIDAEMASAAYRNGFLRITLPRKSGAVASSGEAEHALDTAAGNAEIGQREMSGAPIIAYITALANVIEPARGALPYICSEETSDA